MRLSDLVKDWVLETDLFEMAYQRKKAINIITGLQQPIARHVVKYLHYDASNETKNHWIAEINAWLYTIDEIKLKNNKKLSPEVYYKLLFDEPLGELTDLQGIVKNIDKDDSMSIYDKSNTLPETHEKCEKILYTISHDLANNKFTKFTDYIDMVK